MGNPRCSIDACDFGCKERRAMNYQQIKYEVQDHILTVTLNRPERLNAFTPVMQDELISAFERADADDDIKAIVVTGAGRAFCAGVDLSDETTFDIVSGATGSTVPQSTPPVDWSGDEFRDGGGRVTLRIFKSLKPVIGAINGAAVGFGATMQLPMDIRIASENARFGFVFARRGIVSEAASSWFLPRVVGISQALEWCYSGRVFSAQEALAGRLVSRVVPSQELLAVAYAISRDIVQNSAPVSVALMRQMMWRMLGADDPMEAHKIDSRAMQARSASADAREGFMSFLEKRHAHFSGMVSKDMPPFFPWWEEREYC